MKNTSTKEQKKKALDVWQGLLHVGKTGRKAKRAWASIMAKEARKTKKEEERKARKTAGTGNFVQHPPCDSLYTVGAKEPTQ